MSIHRNLGIGDENGKFYTEAKMNDDMLIKEIGKEIKIRELGDLQKLIGSQRNQKYTLSINLNKELI